MATPSSPPPPKLILQVEARLTPTCSIPYPVVRERIRSYMANAFPAFVTCYSMYTDHGPIEDEFLSTHVERLWIGGLSKRPGSKPVSKSGSGSGWGSGWGSESVSSPPSIPSSRPSSRLSAKRPSRPSASESESGAGLGPRSGAGLSLGLGSGYGTKVKRLLKPGSSLEALVGLRAEVVAVRDVDLAIHVYQFHDQEVVEEYSGDMDQDHYDHGQGSGESVMMARHWTLPCQEFEDIWENLVFDDPIKTNLPDYVRTMLLFSERNVNPNLISWNRIVLLHGPPGTGKTSLCRALAQKLSIQLLGKFRYGKLLEINSHSLFSKWFSESGKMVQRMFDQIWNMVEDEHAFVCVLIDEVESLAAARKAALSGNEPTDSIRVVNALLTQIDRLKTRKNVLILTTSNMTEAIDIAFIDRADIKFHIGLPSTKAIVILLATSLAELQSTGIVDCNHISSMPDVTQKLQKIATLATGMSPRAIRKLPFLTFARYLQDSDVVLEEYLDALQQTVEDEVAATASIQSTE